MRISLPILFLVGMMLSPFIAIAQSDGSAVQGDPFAGTSASAPAAVAATSSAAAVPTRRATDAQSTAPATSTSRPPASAIPAQTVPAAASPTPAATSSPAVAPSPAGDPGNNPVLWIVLAAVAVLPFGYLAAKIFQKTGEKKEEKKDCSRCLDIKKLLDKKLQELTDLRGRLEGKVQGMARDKLRMAVKGTAAGDVLALAEQAEKEYGRLKKLYEECMLEFEGRDLSRLERLKIEVDALYSAKAPGRAEWADWLHENHVFVVADNAQALAQRFGANEELAAAAGMLHDIADAVMEREDPLHEERGTEIARDFLQKTGFNDGETRIVIDDAIRFHGCHGNDVPQTPEGKVMATADALAHLQTDFYDYAIRVFRERGESDADIKGWGLPKIERDYRKKMSFDDVRAETVPDYERVKALYEALEK